MTEIIEIDLSLETQQSLVNDFLRDVVSKESFEVFTIAIDGGKSFELAVYEATLNEALVDCVTSHINREMAEEGNDNVEEE